NQGDQSLGEKLQIKDKRLFYRVDGEILSCAAATPAAATNDDGILLLPLDLPLDYARSTETFAVERDESGIFLDPLGDRERITGVKYNGRQLFCVEETPGSTTRVAAWLDDTGHVHRLSY